MSFLSILHTIEEDVLKGIEIAAPIVGTFVPAAGPILLEVAQIIAALEGVGATTTTHPPAAIGNVVSAVATVSAVKQHAASLSGIAVPNGGGSGGGPITVPVPFPEPIAGGGGPDTYQSRFNTAYYKSRQERLQPFFYGRPGSESGTELTQDQKWDLADQLALEKVDFDEEIEPEGMEPYATMYQRSQVYGYTRVPVGTGRKQSNEPVNPADFQGPVVPGYLLVSCDINDFPPRS